MHHYLYYFVLTISLLIFFGCSPTSQIVRYGKNSEQNQNSVTITSVDTLTNYDNNDIAEYLDQDDIPEESMNYSILDVMRKLEKTNELSIEQTNAREKLIMEIIKYLDTPYKYGGSTLNGIDCSAFTQLVYQAALNINLNRTARNQFAQGKVIGKDELQLGDLVFFNTRKGVKPGHVGIYIGNGLFVHASSKGGVKISSIDENYYSKRFMGARRVVDDSTF